MKKSNKKIPKTYLPKYLYGDEVPMNQQSSYNPNVNPMYRTNDSGMGPNGQADAYRAPSATNEGTQNIYNQKRSSGMSANQYAQAGMQAANNGMNIYNAYNTKSGSLVQDEQNQLNARRGMSSQGIGMIPVVGQFINMKNSLINPTLDRMDEKKYALNEEGTDFKDPKKAKTHMLGRAFANPTDFITKRSQTPGGFFDLDGTKMLNHEKEIRQQDLAAQKAQEDAYAQQQTDYQNQQQSMMDAAFARGFANQNQTGGNTYVQYAKYGGQMKYAMGGMNMQPNAEVEDNEMITSNTPPQVFANGGVELASNNPYGTPTYKTNGASHENGGIPMNMAPGSIVNGKTKNPLTGNKFTKDIDILAKQENKFTKKAEAGDKYSKINAKLILPILAQKKDYLNNLQNAIIANNEQRKALNRGELPQPSMDNEQIEPQGKMPMGGVQLPYYNTDNAGNPIYANGGKTPKSQERLNQEKFVNDYYDELSQNQFASMANLQGKRSGPDIWTPSMQIINSFRSNPNLDKLSDEKYAELTNQALSGVGFLRKKYEPYLHEDFTDVPKKYAMGGGYPAMNNPYHNFKGNIPMYHDGGVNAQGLTKPQYEQAQRDSMTLYKSGFGKVPNYKFPGFNDAQGRLTEISGIGTGETTIPRSLQGGTGTINQGSNDYSGIEQYQKPLGLPWKEYIPATEKSGVAIENKPLEKPVSSPNWGSTTILKDGRHLRAYPDGHTEIVGNPRKVVNVGNLEKKKYGGQMPKYKNGSPYIDPSETDMQEQADRNAYYDSLNQINSADNTGQGFKVKGMGIPSDSPLKILPKLNFSKYGAHQGGLNVRQPSNEDLRRQTFGTSSGSETLPGADPNSKNFDWGSLALNAGNFAGQNMGNIYDLSRKNEPLQKYDRATASYLDATAAIRDANEQTRRAEYNIRGASGGNAGTYLANRVGLNAQNIMTKDRIRQQYANANAGIANQTNQFNTEIAYREAEARAKDAAMKENIRSQAIHGIGTSFGKATKSGKEDVMDQKTLEMYKQYYNNPQFRAALKKAGYDV